MGWHQDGHGRRLSMVGMVRDKEVGGGGVQVWRGVGIGLARWRERVGRRRIQMWYGFEEGLRWELSATTKTDFL